MESYDPWRTATAKALSWVNTDTKIRKCGERRGLDTLVVHTLNDGGYSLGYWLCSQPRSEGIKLPAWGV